MQVLIASSYSDMKLQRMGWRHRCPQPYSANHPIPRPPNAHSTNDAGEAVAASSSRRIAVKDEIDRVPMPKKGSGYRNRDATVTEVLRQTRDRMRKVVFFVADPDLTLLY